MGRIFPYAFAVGCALAPAFLSAASLEEQVSGAVDGFKGRVSLYAKNLETGRTFSRDGDGPVRTASTIKLAIMMECYAEAAEGKLQLSEPLELKANERVEGSGILQDLTPGLRLSVRDMIRLMIVLSDNTATNLVLNRIGGDAVNARVANWGLVQTRCMRKILHGDNMPPDGITAEGRKPENKRWGLGRSSPHEMVSLLERLYGQSKAGDGSANEMIEVLKHQRDRDGILRDTKNPVIASKSGALDHLRSDVGIVFDKAGDVALAITVDDVPEVNWTPENPALLLIARLSEMLVSGLRTTGEPSAALP